jgi:hypothetical protein
VADLHKNMDRKYGEDDMYSVVLLKQLLKAEYGSNIIFSNESGLQDNIGFTSLASAVMRDKWYDQRKPDIADESTRVVVAAA